MSRSLGPARRTPRLEELECRAVPAAPSVLVTYNTGIGDELLGEFSSAGVLLSTREIPASPGDTAPHNARDVDVTEDGRWAVYNGTNKPSLALYDRNMEDWQQLQFPQWSTRPGDTHGGLTVAGPVIYVPDANTFQAEATGIVRFDLGHPPSTYRLANGIEYLDLNLGGDGKLYALRGVFGPIDVYDPATQIRERVVRMQAEAGPARGLAANVAGEIFVLSRTANTVFKLAPSGAILGQSSVPQPPAGFADGTAHDIDISNDGVWLVTGSVTGYIGIMTTDFTQKSFFRPSEEPVFVTFNELPPPSEPPLVPYIRVSDATVIEGHAGTAALKFTVRLYQPTVRFVYVDYATQDQSAVAGDDYEATSGTVTFAPGETVKTVIVPVIGERHIEPDEALTLSLSNPVHGQLAIPFDVGRGTIKSDDHNPVARAGPDRTRNEGAPVRFTAFGSFDPDREPLTYEWDFGDGQTGSGFAVTHRFADEGTYTVRLTARDPYEGVGTDEVLVTVRNVAPRGRIQGPAVSVPGWDRPFTFTGIDPGALDQLHYQVDWGDGQVQNEAAGSSLTLAHAYAAPGIYTIRLRVADEDDGLSPEYVKRVLVAPTVVEGGIRFVPGTGGDDTIAVNAANAAGTMVTVMVNGQPAGTWAAGPLAVLGLSGNDTVTTTGPVAARLMVFGGTGNDTIDVESAVGPAILAGGAGDDTLKGGSGRELLVGGDGLDQLNGRGADDILIGGALAFEADAARLKAVGVEWARPTAAYELRRDRLLGLATGGLNGKHFLNPVTVLPDGWADTLTGGAGRDWFFNTAATPDILSDAAVDETITTV
jgi:PKD domain/Calx-beta domain/RTX calcium-binding nonapeptide repeat (4 copies)